ncbi:CIC11C00000001566 [Sungouiella intermedia]|uniref:CIC11C00000001566 n=1 Tax=Sungouiella intermedia TaxID=45354 RepID=A0A1L0D560_9ASCO|nr:CIC11C00000001566 [[Candida] intermedia]
MLPPASSDHNLMNEHAYYERGVEEQQMQFQNPLTVAAVAVVAGFTLYKLTSLVMKAWRKDRKGPILPEHAI